MDQTQRTDEREGEKRIILSQMFEWWISLPPLLSTNRSFTWKQQLFFITLLGMQDYHMIIASWKCHCFNMCCTTDLMWWLHKVQMASLHGWRLIMQHRTFALRGLLMCHVPSNRMNHIILFLVVVLQNAVSYRLGWMT
jgi:hypothetical protein